MSKFDNPPPEDWSELEKEEDFFSYLIIPLSDIILRKKFGNEVMDPYRTLLDPANMTIHEIRTGLDNSESLFPEVHKLVAQLLFAENLEHALELANENQVTLTKDEIEQAKKEAVEQMMKVDEE